MPVPQVEQAFLPAQSDSTGGQTGKSAAQVEEAFLPVHSDSAGGQTGKSAAQVEQAFLPVHSDSAGGQTGKSAPQVAQTFLPVHSDSAGGQTGKSAPQVKEAFLPVHADSAGGQTGKSAAQVEQAFLPVHSDSAGGQTGKSAPQVKEAFLPAQSDSAGGQTGKSAPQVAQTFLSVQEQAEKPAPQDSEIFLSTHPFRLVDPDSAHIFRRRLPHWEQKNRIYFVTFRLADSIAQKKLAEWKDEIEKRHFGKNETERRRLYFQYRENWLDQGYGACILKNPAISEIVENSLRYFDGEKYLLGDYVIMPNHVHLLVMPLAGESISSVIKSWQGYSARKINRFLQRSGAVWRDESFDHIVRSSQKFIKFRQYIIENPQKGHVPGKSFRLGYGQLSTVEQAFLLVHADSAGGQTGKSAPQVAQTFLSVQEQAEKPVPGSIQNLLAQPRRIHMIGIGGIGMAGLAFLLKQRGHDVRGSDDQENRQTAWLHENGIPVFIGRSAGYAAGAEWIIRSTAVPDSHPELIAGIPAHRRGEVLPEILRDRFTVAVSGTHGKTTTAAMIAQVLDCGFCIGGEIPAFNGVARDGEIMVVEADESDGTVALYHPDIAVITNIEYDHMEHHDSVEAFEACFKKFIANTKESVVYCAEDPAAVRLCAGMPHAVPYFYAATPVSLAGKHNQLNAGAAAAVARRWKTDAEIAAALQNIQPVRRRFEKIISGKYTVISDYAHHPTEIRALIQTALAAEKPARLLAVFQPHRYTRTRALRADFPPAFSGVDKLWLVPVYAASEEPLAGGTTPALMQEFPAEWQNRLVYAETLDGAQCAIQNELRAGDLLLIIGAGDVEKIGEQFLQRAL
ncbi:MAG: Mur ligase domain-containing protein [Kiritimatiellales bacterium]